ncbi:MAG TPA: hypothetical protein VFB66_02570 [Tepidisphaeraceae bacterium]|nr:hypothetical protein [Tepidisphaeraceae bacterium]
MKVTTPDSLSRFGAAVLLTVTVTVSVTGCASQHPADNPANRAQLASAQSPFDAFATAAAASDTMADAAVLAPQAHRELEALVTPPAGWRPDPIKRSRNHSHQTWLSPTRRTAYGVIKMKLPLPFIGSDTVLKAFLQEMKKSEGEARLISRRNDSDLRGIRFVAEGGQYKIRTNLVTRGFRAWAVYAGTLRGQEEMPEELRLADEARERTKIGTTRGG